MSKIFCQPDIDKTCDVKLEKLIHQPKEANLLNLDNTVFASYDSRSMEGGTHGDIADVNIFNTGPGEFKTGIKGEKYRFTKNHLDLIRPVLINDSIIGMVHIRASLKGLQSRLKWFAAILGGSMVIFIFFAYLVSSQFQHIISRPILRLAHHMQTVSRDKNYAIRAKKSGNDEVGILINGFNEMLEQTQIRDEELNRQRNRLSDLVSKRTAELKISEEQKQQLLFQQTIQEAYGKIVGLLNSIDISEILEKSLNEIVPQSGSLWGAFYLAGENSNSLKLTKSVRAKTAPEGDQPDPFFLASADQLAHSVFNSQIEASEPLTDSGIHRWDQRISLTAFPLGFQNKPQGALVLAAEKTFSGWHLSIRDIFEVFQQEDKSTATKYGGTGLGLSLCKQFIELHKGGIWVESRPDKGSTFSFLLPIYEIDPNLSSPINASN